MKHLQLLKNAAIAALLVLAISGCKKDYQEPVPVSALSFYQVSPDAPFVSVLLNSNQINRDSLAYNDHIDYLNAYSGTRQASAYQRNVKKASADVTLLPGRFYSLFLTGKFASSEFVLLEDSLANPGAGKASIRFVNMSVESPSLDLGLDNGSTLISGKVYKANSGYTAVEADKQYNFVIRDHGSTVNKSTIPSVTLRPGRLYTVLAKGIYTATGATGLSGGVITNY